MATAKTLFSLRPLERNTPSTALEGAFRVHISMKELKALGLANGDLVHLKTSNGSQGLAVAWLAASANNPGNKFVAKVTDLWREKYGLSLQDRVTIEKANAVWKSIDSLEISYPESAGPDAGHGSPETLIFRATSVLVIENLDMIFPGCTFEIPQGGPKALQNSAKLRATVESMEPATSLEIPLYVDPTKTTVRITGAEKTSKPIEIVKPSPSPTEPLKISGEGIGGLADQIQCINEWLALLSSNDPADFLSGPTAILIHGPEGMGKSLLLNRLAKCAWQQVFTLDLNWLASNSKGSAKAMSEVFGKARGSQPSIIIIEELDKLLAKAESLVACLSSELRNIEGSQIAVAAAARNVYDIDTNLRTALAFQHDLELLPPNLKQREDMLREILQPVNALGSVDIASLAERTHGYVGRDIISLCKYARGHHRASARHSLSSGKYVAAEKDPQGEHRVTQEDFDAVIDRVKPTVLGDGVLEVPKVKWSDIAGVDHVRKLLDNIIVRPLKYPELDAKFGDRDSHKGILLYGPPGCAKTLIAQAVATESNQNFLAVKGSELIQTYVGESEKALRGIFRRALAAKPCIIFFDEIDSIGKSREKSQDSGLNMVATLLNEMDGIEALKDVFIIAATNRPDILDTALIRVGRFDSHIHIGLPTEEARRQILQIHTRKRPLAGDVDLVSLASRTEGSSGADISGLCRVAANLAKDDYVQSPESQAEIRMCHFERALENHVPHTIKEDAARYENWRPGKSLSAY
ncbi:AAA-domain-containing protein [Amniculicola lignicola CBS 123094]|uniref:AAA-domain-containing protein n=1 Tax=Amniculicola lignicola CBS 123094 TaxID=1392246 RepID=A0A6A5X0T2_9PLEO|nr:AAA-domain-containing protein [Amniculicola lignicola CBS 123094]